MSIPGGAVADMLETYVPVPLSRQGQKMVRDCTSSDLESAIRIFEKDKRLDMTSRMKQLRKMMMRYGAVRPVYLPYIQLEKVVK
jgi:hypothetical protein